MNLSGWFATWVLIALLMTATVYCTYCASRTFWRFAVVTALSGALFWPLYVLVNGDVSRVLPNVIWSDGADGKDQIIIASIASTFLLPLLLASLVVLLFTAIKEASGKKSLGSK